jgi:C_GCAxxG_C_C family probable redox protein
MSLDRREFLRTSCSCLGFLSVAEIRALTKQAAAEDASMKTLTLQHLTEGYWSADSLLLSAAKYLKEREDIVRVATGFGGGILQKDLCGFVTGGVMAIGLFSGAVKGNDKAARDKCHRLTKEYMKWWAENYPLRCGDIKQPCDYKGMGEKASDFLQGVFERESKKA